MNVKVCDIDCMCVKCLMADRDAHLAAQGKDLAKFAVQENAATVTRTRYAKPGQRAGDGFVRLVSPAQVRFIKNLMRDRDMSNLVCLPGSEDIEKMSLRGARDLIDRLLACPMKEVSPVTRSPFDTKPAVRMASNKQVFWILQNSVTKDVRNAPADVVAAIDLAQQSSDAASLTRDSDGSSDTVPFAIAKAALDYLFNAPYKPREVAAPTKTVGDGIYLVNGDVFKVQTAHHGSGKKYAKKLDMETGCFEYASGAITGIKPEHSITQTQALEIVKGLRANMETLSHCFACGRPLTKETSMERGMGEHCYNKLV